MTEAQAVEAIFERWTTQWAILHPSDVPFTFDNEEFTGVPKWVRVAVGGFVRNQVSIGPTGVRRYEARGNIGVQLFGNVDKGAYEVASLADDVRLVLEGQLIAASSGDSVYTYAGSTRPIATNGNWNMSLVVIPFSFYEQR